MVTLVGEPSVGEENSNFTVIHRYIDIIYVLINDFTIETMVYSVYIYISIDSVDVFVADISN